MSMHLVRGMSIINTRKRKKKGKTKSLISAEREHQKFLQRMGLSGGGRIGDTSDCKSVDKGSSPFRQSNRSVAQSGSAPALGAGGQRFESSHSDQLPTWDSSMCKKQQNKYTGSEIIGVAVMHKSNAIPVRGKQAAIEVARMRRG